jgi:hypothetical protein
LRDLDAMIQRCVEERSAVRQEITRERARELLQGHAERAAFMSQVMARWDQGMSASQIAKVLNSTPAAVARIVAEFRQQERVTIRRERRRPRRGL